MSEENKVQKQAAHGPNILRFRISRYQKRAGAPKAKYIMLITIPISTILVIALVGQFIGSEQVSEWFDDNLEEEEEDKDEYKTDLTFQTIDGKTIKLADHEGEVVLLFFFDLPCGPCGPEADIISDIDDTYSSNDLFILAIDVLSSDSISGIQSFASDHDLDCPIVRDDSSSTISSEFDIKWTPTVIILDQDGDIEETMIGGEEGSYANIKNTIDSLL